MIIIRSSSSIFISKWQVICFYNPPKSKKAQKKIPNNKK